MFFFKKSLKKLVKAKSISVKKGKYYMHSIKPSSWGFRMQETKKLLERNQHVIDVLGFIPWIKMIGITGSIGAYNATKEADIDILIVSENNRLWITRLFVIAILKIFNKYPTKNNEREKFCPNIMVDEENMAWPRNKRNIYTANEVALLQPVYDKDETYLKFIRINSWVFEYLGNFPVEIPKKIKITSKRSELLDKVDTFLMERQIRYMATKMTQEIVKKGFIHFNVSDSAPSTLKTYRELLKKMEIAPSHPKNS